MDLNKLILDNHFKLFSSKKKNDEMKQAFLNIILQNYNKNNKNIIYFDKANYPVFKITNIKDYNENINIKCNVLCSGVYDFKYNFTIRPIKLIKNYISYKRDLTIEPFLSIIEDVDDVLHFIKNNKYFTTIYEVELTDNDKRKEIKEEVKKAKLKQEWNEHIKEVEKKLKTKKENGEIIENIIFNFDDETDESITDDEDNINFKKLNRIKEKLKLKKKKYNQNKKNKKLLQQSVFIEDIKIKNENDDLYSTDENKRAYYVKVIFKHSINTDERKYIKKLVYDLVNTSKIYNDHLRSNDIKIIKVIKPIHSLDTHFNIVELKSFDDDVYNQQVKHFIIKDEKIVYITEITKTFI
jgi:hypothetical protein